MKYRKKAVVIDAAQWFKNGDHPLDYSQTHGGYEDGAWREFSPELRKSKDWGGDIIRRYRTTDLDGQTSCKHCKDIMHNHGWIETLEGGHIVCPGDWIITGVKGEHYPCKPDIFEMTYEREEAQTALVDRAKELTEIFDGVDQYGKREEAQTRESVAVVTCDGVMGVRFTEAADYGCALPLGTELFTRPTTPPSGDPVTSGEREAPPMNAWVAVSERLPAPWTEVMVFPRPEVNICEAYMGREGAAVFWEYWEYDSPKIRWAHRCEVTYWMPLPAAPRGVV